MLASKWRCLVTTTPNNPTPPKSHQETFDIVVRALLKPGRPSVEPRPDDLKPDEPWTGGTCQYRGDGGMKCAAGHLIPDDKYDPAMEGAVCVDGLGFGPVLDKTRRVHEVLESEGYDPKFVRALQEAHDLDSDDPPEKWLIGFRTRARGVAERFGLNADVVDAPAEAP